MPLTDVPRPVQRSSWTDEYSYTDGIFDISQIPIRYFLTSIPIGSLANCFRLVEDIPGSENWGYSAIFQRDIDEDRVKEELLEDYLLVREKFKFFNPLTIALLPFDQAEQKILNNYRDPRSCTPEGIYIKERIDGIELTKLADVSVGNIKWDLQRIVATAIDGQHRLSALLKFAAAPPTGIDPTRSQVPVILLIFNHDRGEILKQVREIFVDINKTAKPVSKQRGVLLDDRDMFAIMARDLVHDDVSNTDGLPYEVVDWRRESPKPDAPHQMTSILVLYQCVERLFGSRARTVDAYLQVNDALRNERLAPLGLAARECITTNKQAEVLLQRFRPRHKKFLLAVFTKLEPFRAFLALLDRYVNAPNGSYLKEFLFKPEAKRDVVRERMRRKGVDDKSVIDGPITDLQNHKNPNNLLFYSIGQRGLFHWFYRIQALYRGRLSTTSLEIMADAYIEDLNILNRIGFFNRDFKVNNILVWEGLCIRSGRLVASSGSAQRIGALTLLAITTLRMTPAQTVHEHIVEQQKVAFRQVEKALEPMMLTEEEEEEITDTEGEELDEDDIDEDEDIMRADLRSLARNRLLDVLRWVKDTSTIAPSAAGPGRRPARG